MMQRMNNTERCKQLRHIMLEHYKRARKQDEFIASAIAEKAEVSVVWFYRKLGDEFKELRGQLPGRRRSPSSVIRELKQEVGELSNENRELKSRHESKYETALINAYKLIEEQDEVIRILTSRLEMAEHQMKDGPFVVVQVAQASNKSSVGPRTSLGKS